MKQQTKDISNPDIPLDLAALIFGQAQDFNTIFLAALEQDKRKPVEKQETDE